MQITKQEMEVLKVLKQLKTANAATVKSVYEEQTKGKIGNIWDVFSRLSQEGLVKRVDERDYSLTETAMDALEGKKKEQKASTLEFTNEEQRQFKEIAKDPEVLNRLSGMFASHLIGLEAAKKAVLISLVSQKDQNNCNNRISVLLEGKPGTGKSQMIRWAKDNLWGEFADARILSGVGLVGSVAGGGSDVNDGMLVIANDSELYIDELDKFSKEDQGYLLGAMSNGSITINKGGVRNRKEKTEVRVIATTNNKNELLKELKDRFDLIYYLENPTGEEKIKIIRDKINNWNRPGYKITEDLFIRYMQFANQYETKLPEDRESLTEHIIYQIKSGVLKGEAMRKTESIFRISLAIARLKLKPEVDKEDLKGAIELIRAQKEG